MKYKGFYINTSIFDRYKYDIRDGALYVNSADTITEAKEYINRVLWTRANIPF